MTVPAAPSLGRAAWLVLACRLPASHALKTTVRRRLTAIGAVFPVNAVAALPASPAAERAFRRLRRMIGEAGSSAQVLAGIEALTAAGQFRYPDPGDKDAELKLLSMRNDTIRARDVLGAANADLPLSAPAGCRAVVDDFAVRVSQTDSASITGVVHRPRSPGASS